MSKSKKTAKPVPESNKNILDTSTVESGRDTFIGDQTTNKTTINVYRQEASQKDLEFFIKVYVILIAIFGLAALVFLVVPDLKNKVFPDHYIASFVSGGFFALSSLFLLLLYRSKKNASVNLNQN